MKHKKNLWKEYKIAIIVGAGSLIIWISLAILINKDIEQRAQQINKEVLQKNSGKTN